MDEPFDYLFKIILIGDSNVGKTCVVHRFKSGQYHAKTQNTIGVDFTVRSLEIDGKKVKVRGTRKTHILDGGIGPEVKLKLIPETNNANTCLKIWGIQIFNE